MDSRGKACNELGKGLKVTQEKLLKEESRNVAVIEGDYESKSLLLFLRGEIIHDYLPVCIF